MERAEVSVLVYGLLGEEMGITRRSFNDNYQLRADLGFDSLDFVELRMGLKRTFVGVEFEEDGDLFRDKKTGGFFSKRRPYTVGDLVDDVYGVVQKQGV